MVLREEALGRKAERRVTLSERNQAAQRRAEERLKVTTGEEERRLSQLVQRHREAGLCPPELRSPTATPAPASMSKRLKLEVIAERPDAIEWVLHCTRCKWTGSGTSANTPARSSRLSLTYSEKKCGKCGMVGVPENCS